jgi:hypothetical protein
MAIVSRGGATEYDKLKQALNVFGDEYITELTKQLIQLDKVATGKLLRSLDYKVVEQIQGQFTIIIQAQNYLKWVDAGRKASGKMPPVKPFLEWVKARNIRFRKKDNTGFLTREQTAFVIARSLKTKNILPTNVLKTTLGNVLNLRAKIIKNGAKLDFEELVNSIMSEIKE